MEIKYLESVLAVYKYRSFSEAAFALSLSSSAVSKHISAVEKELGVLLFNRATKSHYVTLTEFGQQIIPDIEDQVERYASLQRKAVQLKDSSERMLRIGYQPVAGSLGERLAVTEFYKRNPNIKIELISAAAADLIRLLNTGRLDGCFVFGEVLEDDKSLQVYEHNLDSEKYGFINTYKSKKMYIALSENHPLAQRDKISVYDLKHDTLITNNAMSNIYAETSNGQFFISHLKNLKNQFMDFNMRDILYESVASGFGLLPTTTYTGESYKGVVFLPLVEWTSVITGYFIYKRDTQSKIMRSFRRCVSDNNYSNIDARQMEIHRP